MFAEVPGVPLGTVAVIVQSPFFSCDIHTILIRPPNMEMGFLLV
jgi:hypothetical protein